MFTAIIRQRVASSLGYLGVRLDSAKNLSATKRFAEPINIASNGEIPVFVVAAEDEAQMALSTQRLLDETNGMPSRM